MARDVFFRGELADHLASLLIAFELPIDLNEAAASPAIQSYFVGYRDGFRKALQTVAVAFGIRKLEDTSDNSLRGD